MNDSVNPALAARADSAFNDMMKALELHDIDAVRDLVSINYGLLDSVGGGIDIKTALKG